MDSKLTFGERLKKERIEKGMSRRAFALSVGVAPSTMIFYESDERLPDFRTFEKMADVLDVSCDYLMGRTDSKTREATKPADSLGLTDEALEVLSSLTVSAKGDSSEALENEEALNILSFLLTRSSHLFTKIARYFMIHESSCEEGVDPQDALVSDVLLVSVTNTLRDVKRLYCAGDAFDLLVKSEALKQYEETVRARYYRLLDDQGGDPIGKR